MLIIMSANKWYWIRYPICEWLHGVKFKAQNYIYIIWGAIIFEAIQGILLMEVFLMSLDTDLY